MYRGFGTDEVTSVIEAAAWLKSNLSYIDPTRTAIWGWSYGGFLSLSVLGHDDDDVFTCGASVAPVVDWRLYDTYYTERYMDLLDNNLEGYEYSRVFKRLEPLRRKPFYMMHGTHDDNVHYQQSMLLAAALEEKDILFRQQSYPDQDHSINDYHLHIYHSLTDFFLNDCSGKERLSKRRK
jgi:dipeptidyl-peptidase-4